VACSRSASSAIFAFSPASIRRLVFFVIVRSVYQTERPVSNLAPGPKIGVHFSSGSLFWSVDIETRSSRLAVCRT